MSDLIKLLPDSVANQIAAGEVIQRPASAIKELVENAIDAGSTNIQVVVKDAGKSFMQVNDNGNGMSEYDARICFERHATSKISQADDLFSITTMGFRGEALASIASVAMVELKTRTSSSEIGTCIEINGSKVERQEPIACSQGTSITVKNLFFNIPARRNFLKSNAAETRHIVEEFQRTAIAHPEKSFALIQDGVQVFQLAPGNLKQRIAGIYGNSYNERVVPVQEDTTILKLEGFIVKPEFSRKTRGEQYIFVNKRFIKSSYINHAITESFDAMLPVGTFPSYFLFLEIDPSKIDVNIHPTKTEIKFEDERSVYAIIRAAVKRALGKFSITPSLDFDQETAFNIPVSMYGTMPKAPEVKIDKSYNPFLEERKQDRNRQWEALYPPVEITKDLISSGVTDRKSTIIDIRAIGQLEAKYIIAVSRSGLMAIDQKRAHERILYEEHMRSINQAGSPSQQTLFPATIEFPHDEAPMIKELLGDLRKLGIDLREFGGNTFVLNGVPEGTRPGTEREMIEAILESYKNDGSNFKEQRLESLLKTMVGKLAITYGTVLNKQEQEHLIEALFNCEKSELNPHGKPIYTQISLSELDKRL
jgi:DNA mismatch repair protein MutL